MIAIIFLIALTLSACGGSTSGSDSDANDDSGNGGGADNGDAVSDVSQLDLIASATTLTSAAVQNESGVVLTAIARDSDNNAVADPDIEFNASSGRLELDTGTSSNGTATALLYNDPDRANRTITVTASSGGVSDSIQIEVSGTRLSIAGPDAVATGDDARFTATLVDSSGDPIQGAALTLQSELNPPVSAGTVDTNASGEATFRVTETNPGTDNVSASGRGATAVKTVKVGGERITFVTATDEEPPTVGTEPLPLQVRYSDDSGPIVDQQVAFTASRGDLRPESPPTNAQGIAETTLQSRVAGPSTVTASAGGVQASRTINFRAADPSTLILNAASTTLAPNESTTLRVTVRDEFSNLVEDERVNFALAGGGSGTLSSSQALTNDAGVATVTYTAGSSSATEPVEITATVAADDSITDSASLTIAGEALSIRLGTGSAPDLSTDGTTYAWPYAVLISDAAGNPVSEASLRLSIRSQAYQASDNPDGSIICPSEDINNNGILDADEDDGDGDNGNGTLEPGRVATVPVSPTLDDSGVARFDVTYLSRFAQRVEVELTATAEAAGSEGAESLTFVLDGARAGTNPFDSDCSSSQTTN
ncbi:hypothetical protein GCM10028792_26280 [Salinisphaera aquimarina]